jgi:hypothetical protein
VVVRGIACKSVEARGKNPPLYDHSCVGKRNPCACAVLGAGGKGVHGCGGVLGVAYWIVGMDPDSRVRFERIDYNNFYSGDVSAQWFEALLGSPVNGS